MKTRVTSPMPADGGTTARRRANAVGATSKQQNATHAIRRRIVIP
jgi:hypothetical protein